MTPAEIAARAASVRAENETRRIRAELRDDPDDWRAEDRLLAALVRAKAWAEVVEAAEVAIQRMEARRAASGAWDGDRAQRVCLVHRVAKGLAEGTHGG